MILGFIFAFVIFILCLYTFKDVLIKDFKQFKKDPRKNIETVFWYWFLVTIAFAISIFLTRIILSLDSTTQIEINPHISFLIIISMIIFTPVVEECLLRYLPRTFIKNKYAYMILSSAIFAALHFTGGIGVIFPFFVYGLIMCHLYLKHNNIFINIAVHFVYNLMVVVMSNLAMLFI